MTYDKNTETGKHFIEHTKYQNLLESAQLRGFPAPELQMSFDADAHIIDLPNPVNESKKHASDLHETIYKRVSVRNYKDESLSLAELSLLLFNTQGVKKVVRNIQTLRNVPSAGARHALETWLLINRIDDLNPGLYRYLPLSHQLVLINGHDKIADTITEACLGQQMISKSAVTFIWTAMIERMRWRYSERAYRYILLDAGHVCQNLYLSAVTLNCGTCAIAAFDDDQLNKSLNIDGNSQFAVYAASVGRQAKG